MEHQAQQSLRAWLRAEGRKSGWVAAQIGVHQCTVSHWVRGHRVPHPGARAALAALTGLDISDESTWR